MAPKKTNRDHHIYEHFYKKNKSFFGEHPAPIIERFATHVSVLKGMSALDIGCGEGRNALYLARLGCRCTCLDISMTGLARTRENARKQGVRIKTIVADMNSHHLKNKFDLIFSTNTLQFMPVKHRKNIIGDYKNHTVTDGYNVFAVFVKKPYIQVPNHEKSSKPWTSGELFSYYWDWQIEFCGETVYDCDCGGTPHKHAVNTLIAKKVA